MYCSKCGKEILDEAVVCVHCGCAVQPMIPNTQQHNTENDTETNVLAVVALAFAFLMPIIGLILGVIGCAKYRNEKYRNWCIYSIGISILVWVFCLLIIMSL